MMTSEITVSKNNTPQVSIIIPTYNESQNIIRILKSIGENLPTNTKTEAIVVDDSSPDGTGRLAENFSRVSKNNLRYKINVIHRKAKKGLGSAILKGIQHAEGDTIVIMDSDFSHPPNIIPKMVDTLKKSHFDIVVASRYVKGGVVVNWPLKRKVMSKVATSVAKKGLGIKTEDPMSGFFAFKRQIINGLKLDAIGYKMLLEILVKAKGVTVKEIPYTFTERELGSSKVTISTVIDYGKSVWRLYKYGKTESEHEKRASVKFISKAGRFFTVGASGLGVNYLISFLLTTGIIDLWYLHANIAGIIVSMTTNFFLNKVWTFEDKDFSARTTFTQYAKFVGFSSAGALVQLGMVFWLVDINQVMYPIALILAVLTAALGNFILNKKWTFKERVWG